MLTPLLVLLAGVSCLALTLLLLRVDAAMKEQKIRRLQIQKIRRTSHSL
jgi:hypothetical protein